MSISCVYRNSGKKNLKADLWKEDAVQSGMGTYLLERHQLQVTLSLSNSGCFPSNHHSP